MTYAEPTPVATEEGDDTLSLLFCCCHPDLAPASQVALTLRAVGGLTTREIADAFYVPEATMAQRISRAKRTLQGRRLDQPGDLAVVLRVLYLVYTAGHAGRVDLAGEAIRLARQLTLATEEPEARGLLALMLLNHARLPARVDAEGRIVISTYPERAKTANARRRAEVSVLVLSDDFGGEWVQVDGDCEVLDLPESVEPLVDYFRAISGEHPDWDEYRQAMREQDKSLLRVTPTRWGPVATGGFPARLVDEGV